MAHQMQQLSSKRAEQLGSLAVEFECLTRQEFVQLQNDLGLSSREIQNAAKEGNVAAQTILGNMYAGGLGGVEKDLTKAVEWYTKAAVQEDTQDNADAQFHLGEIYESGIGVKKNRILGAEWYAKAAEKGHAHAEVNLKELNEVIKESGV